MRKSRSHSYRCDCTRLKRHEQFIPIKKGSPFQVRGSRGLPYTVLWDAWPPYCACATWRHSLNGDLFPSAMCKHVVAAAVAEASNTVVVRDVDDRAKFVERMVGGTKGH